MTNRIVQLKDRDNNNTYPIAGAMKTDSITTAMLKDSSVTGAKIDSAAYIVAKPASFTATSTNIETVSLDTADYSYGNKFSVSNGRIVVGSGVNHIRISAYVTLTGGVNSNDIIQIYLTKVHNTAHTTITHIYKRGVGSWDTIISPATPLQVEEGDTIYLAFRNEQRSGTQIDSSYTRVNVEAIY